MKEKMSEFLMAWSLEFWSQGIVLVVKTKLPTKEGTGFPEEVMKSWGTSILPAYMFPILHLYLSRLEGKPACLQWSWTCSGPVTVLLSLSVRVEDSMLVREGCCRWGLRDTSHFTCSSDNDNSDSHCVFRIFQELYLGSSLQEKKEKNSI